MLPGKNWRVDAIVRLLMSVFICIYAGSLAAALFERSQGRGMNTSFLWITAGGFASLAVAMVLVRLPITRQNVMRQAAAAIGCFYLGLVLATLAHQMAGSSRNSVAEMVISALSFQGCTILLMGVFLRDQDARWDEGFGLRERPWAAVLLGITLGLAFLPVGWMLQMLSAEVMEHLPWMPIKPVEQQAVQTLRHAGTIAHKIALGVSTIALAPVAEELLFRGVLYKWIKELGFPRLALWGLSFLFAGVHFNAVTFLPLVLLSVALTILYERTGNLLGPITAHASFNAVNYALLYLMQRDGG